MYADVSINKIGSNYSFTFDASNASVPITSDSFNIVGVLDLSNIIASTYNNSLNLKSGTDLSKLFNELHDI